MVVEPQERWTAHEKTTRRPLAPSHRRPERGATLFPDIDPRQFLAALRLLPENSSATVRFECARRLPPVVEQLTTSRAAVALASDPDLREVKAQEDRPAHPFTDRVVGPRGAALVVSGPVQDAVFAFRMLVRGLLQDVRPLKTREHRHVAELVAAGLALADGIATRGSLVAFTRPLFTDDILFADPDRLAPLVNAVTWTDRDIRGIERAPAVLELLAGSDFPAVERLRGRWLIAAPELLVSEMNRLLVADAERRRRSEDLRRRYDAAIWSSVVDSMIRLGATAVTTGADPTERRSRFQLSDECSVEVATLPSALEAESAGRERIVNVDAPLQGLLAAAGTNDVGLIVAQPLADPYFDYSAAGDGPFPLAMSAADLEVLTHLPDSGPETLMRFARSAARARARGGVTRFSTLDEYQLYRELGERHVAPPPGDAVQMLAAPGTAMSLRLAVAAYLGRDAVRASDGRGIVEVTRRHRGADLPVFLPPPEFPDSARVVRLGTCDAWMIWRDGPDADGTLDSVVDGILDSTALFAASAARDQPALFADLPETLTVSIYEAVRGSLRDPDRDGLEPVLLAVAARSPNVIEIAVDPGFVSLAATPDNEADRALLEMLLAGIGLLTGDVDPAAVREAVDSALPRGRRRMLIGVNLGANAAIGPADTPRWRPIASAEVALWSEYLGGGLLSRGRSPGPVRGSDGQGRLLNEAVSMLFEAMTKELAAVAAGPAITWFMDRIEAAYREEGVIRLDLVSAPSVLGEAAGDVAAMREKLVLIPRASVATRFVIEYLAAVAPQGPMLMTDLAGDRIAALASLVVDLGGTSDAVALGSFDGTIEIERNGALAISRDLTSDLSYLMAHETWARQLMAESYDKAWRMDDGDSHSVQLAEVAGAWTAEFGQSAEAFGRFVNAAILIADDRERSLIELPRPLLIDELTARLGWPAEDVEQQIRQLTLGNRDGYLTPSGPFTRVDVYPWRFNRRLSYLRRPFVEFREGSALRTAFGVRSLYMSANYLVELVGSGRLAAESQPMKELMGRLAQERSRDFVASVAAICVSFGAETHIGVHKLGSHRIGHRGNDLGDVDVLAIDRSRATIWAIECKAVSAARTPWEIAHEIKTWTDPGGHLERHGRRVAWLHQRVDLLNETYGPTPIGWSVRGVVVTDVPLPYSYRSHVSGMNVIVASELPNLMAGGTFGGS